MPSIDCELDFDARTPMRRASGDGPLVPLPAAFCRVLQLIRLSCRKDADLAIEVVMLRHEVAVLRRHQVHQPRLEPAGPSGAGRVGATPPPPASRKPLRPTGNPAALAPGPRRWALDVPVRPARSTGHREGKYRAHLPVGQGDPTWGYRRIHGELATMGIVVASSSVWAILKRHGVELSP